VEKIRISGGNAVFLAADPRAPKAAADSIVAYAIHLWGRNDVLVNCAATINYQPAEEVTKKNWDEIFALASDEFRWVNGNELPVDGGSRFG
jgi:NAD(P)-dependent dehydrogenase (short-subunit alcohol dehydrogenase family)